MAKLVPFSLMASVNSVERLKSYNWKLKTAVHELR